MTYAASALHERKGTHRKLESIAADFAASPSAYRLVLLYQRNAVREPFNCSLHAPARAECAEVSRSDMKRAIGHELALHRRGDAPRRLNVGFWVCAIWLVEQERAGRRFPFVWYLEDDVYLPGSWSSFMQRYDATGSAAFEDDLLAPQIPYRLADQHQRRWDGVAEVERGWKRPQSSTAAHDLAIVQRRPGATATQLSIPIPTLAEKLPVRDERLPCPLHHSRLTPTIAREQVTDETLYAKVPLYAWRMRGRLATEVARALIRGAKAHEEFFVPTVCRAVLRDPPCRWATFAAADVGVPCGSNVQDAWYRANRPSFRARLAHNLTDFQAFLGRLQQPGGYRLLPAAPQRLYHPIKGQLSARERRVEANAIG